MNLRKIDLPAFEYALSDIVDTLPQLNINLI